MSGNEMRIMIFNTLYFPYKIGGAEVSVQFLAEEFVAQGHSVMVMCLTEGKVKRLEVINGVQVLYIPIYNVFWPFDSQKKSIIKKIIWHLLDCFNPFVYFFVKRELDKFSPDVIHTNNLAGWSASVWLAARSKKVKVMHTSRDYYLMHPNSSLFSNGKNIDPSSLTVRGISFPKKVLSYYVNSYVGISHFIQKIHCENGFFKNAKQNVIYNSVPVVNVPYTSSSKKRIGFIGRLSVEKGFDIFCELAAYYKDSTKFQFLAAGSFSNKESDNLLKELSIACNIELLGFVNLSDFLSQVDIVFLPIKWHEPFGRVVAECVFAGKIVYTTPVGGITELSTMLPNVIVANDIVQEFKNTCEAVSAKKIDPSFYKLFDKKLIAGEYLAEYFEMLNRDS